MMMLNSLIIEGVIKNEVEAKETKEGVTVASFQVGYTRTYKNLSGEEKKEESIFDVECYEHLAEVIAKYSKNKKNVRIVGKLKKNDNKVLISADHIEFKAK